MSQKEYFLLPTYRKKVVHIKSFDEKCYSLLARIPRGKVTTYKEIAEAMQSRAFRAVGQAMKRNPDAPIVPCHRVVSSSGRLGGYAFGLKRKIAILEEEGIKIKNG